jgi:hypothetical protein
MDPHLEEQLLSVWSGGRDSVFMVGFTTDTNRGLLRRWNGTAWSWAEVGPGAMWEIWGSSSSDVWFGGTGDMAQGFIARGDGMNFEPVEYSGGSLRGIWGTSSEDVWAVPYDGDFQHWDGSSWTEFPLPRGVTATAAIAGIGPSDAWAVGLDGLILHWDGESWTRRASNTDAHLLSVWPANENDAWAVGQDGILLHWNGTDWRETEPAEAE